MVGHYVVPGLILLAIVAPLALRHRSISAARAFDTKQPRVVETGLLRGAATFHHRRGPVGCLLLHGFSSSCQELEELGAYLVDRNITVLCPLLPGHGSSPLDMAKTTRRDWYHGAQEAFELLQSECEEVFVVGLSMGGLLTWRLGSMYDTQGLVALGSLIAVTSLPLRRTTTKLLLWLLSPCLPFYRKAEIGNIKDPEQRAKRVAYLFLPLASVRELFRLADEAWGWMRDVRHNRVLQIASVHDPDPASARRAAVKYQMALPEGNELSWVENSGHIISNDYDRHHVFLRTYEFMCRHSRRLNE